MQPLDPQQHVVGILAGAGEYPRLMVEGAKRAGMRVVVAGFKGAVGKDIPPLCDAFAKFRVGAVEGPRDFFKANGVTHVVMTGQIKPACIYTMWPDATARRLLAQLDRRNAHTIFGAVCDYVAEQGIWQAPPPRSNNCRRPATACNWRVKSHVWTLGRASWCVGIPSPV